MFQRVVRESFRFAVGITGLSLLGACSGGDPVQPLPVSALITLNPGEFALLKDSGVTGSVEFPAAGAGGASYLILGQLATTAGNVPATSFTLGARVAGPGSPFAQVRQAGAAQRFHDMLRGREAEFARRTVLSPSVLGAPPARTPPPSVGSKRTFKVCGDLDCNDNTIKNVLATAQFVGTHAAIFLDDSVPAGGFTPTDIAQVGDQFDQVLWPIDNARFGSESDIDGNTVVIVLLSKRINMLVPEPDCNTSFVTGFFFGADIAPGFASQYNNGEVFYGMVPDPAGTVSCDYSTAYVKSIIPVTFIHEFQHMISFNQHVLARPGSDEVLWLNEAMSHLAEELGGLHYDSLGQSATASRFFGTQGGNLYNAYIWMRNPASNAMMTETPPGSLEERGAGWLFLRYLVDQFGPNLTRTLSQTALTGDANVAAATGTPFRTLLGRWGLAVYLNDAQGVTPPPLLSYGYWDFRSTFAQLHAGDPVNYPLGYPLVPDSGQGSAAFASGTIFPGGGAYIIATQPAGGAGFSLAFRGSNGAAIASVRQPQLAVVRLH